MILNWEIVIYLDNEVGNNRKKFRDLELDRLFVWLVG